MTNANLPSERWLVDRRFSRDRLPDGAYRSYMNALMWSVANRTEGVIEPGDLKDIRDFDRAQIKTLIAVELWESRGPNSGWLIIDFPTTQTGRDLLKKYEKEKALDRARKARARNAKIAEELAELAGERSSGGSSGGKIPAESPRPDKTKPAQTGNRGTAGKKTIPANSTEPTSTCAGTAAAARRSGGRPRVGTTCRCAGRATTPALSTSPMRSGHDAPSSRDSFRRKDGVTPRTTLGSGHIDPSYRGEVAVGYTTLRS